MGKTTLAVHWAHRVKDRFPDGQLYVNLRGFDPGTIALTPAEALHGFLIALGVAIERIPTSLDGRAGLYRGWLAGRRMLVVLDNARDADQIRPLLPAGTDSLVLVTSRDQLPGLVATEAAQPLSLDLLEANEARDLLAGRLGVDRVSAQPVPVNEIVALCSGLPLALAIVAARATTHPTFRLAALANELRAAHDRLDAFASTDQATDMRAVFSWSYQTLSPAAARLFRLLGNHPGPDIAAPATASLAGVPVGPARQLLTELTRAHLLTEHVHGRYAFHDLLRAYSSELARAHDVIDEQRLATLRLLDHYLHTAHAAALLLATHRDPLTISAPQAGATPQVHADYTEAMAWCDAERTVLTRLIRHAADAGLAVHAWQLAWSTADYMYRRAQWHDWADAQSTALQAALRQSDLVGQAHTHGELGHAYAQLRRFDDARGHLRHALRLFDQLHDDSGAGDVLLDIAFVNGLQDGHAEALRYSEMAFDRHRADNGRLIKQVRALANMAWYQALLGDHETARAHCLQALPLFEKLGYPLGEAAVSDTLGYIHHQLGQPDDAITWYERAIGHYRLAGQRHGESGSLIRLGETHHTAGRPEHAREAWLLALDILDQLGSPEAADVRARLDRLPDAYRHAAAPRRSP